MSGTILPDGRRIEAITLRGGGLRATVLTLGAIVQDLRMDGLDHPLVLGCPDPAAYLDQARYVGAIVGRFANRIGGARFELDGVAHRTDPNFLGRHTLHGGHDGTDLHIWRIEQQAADQVTLSLTLPDGHMGFPGTMAIRATIALRDQALVIDMQATSDAATPCNLAHHGYFSLDEGGDIRKHELWIDAAHYLPVDEGLIPLPGTAPVAGTAFDFRQMRPVGNCGYDHNFCLSDGIRPPRPVARLRGSSGLTMTVTTDAPGLQVYDGRHFNGLAGLDGRSYAPHAGIAMETQHWPDAPNRPDFPDQILRPGQTYRHHVAYGFDR
ncbi:aldose 1-epimerase [Paracoccus alcaliphilus]|uniref:Aldose 1-epimerase n=1 Tax=Paracoccus alcaliphilus TaxID=34002 RepID=A0A1H8FV13_9RHOB|nr:aldose epimerase family protein [Paracoccus alcaliphilus]WCR20208.1 galactose mutarotase [Paracoccus alcaliphilus]SEN35370.1 aldose 1-epimerase [Paracoccus alcaliphilus]